MRNWLSRLEHGTGKHAASVWMLPGADVSSWNGTPADWKQSAGRISWAAVKVIEVAYENGELVALGNPDAADDLAYLKSAGKGRILYCFGHPDTPAAATAQMFAAQCADAGIEDGDGIAIDLEVTNGKTAAQISTWADDVGRLLERDMGRVPLIYTFIAYALAGNCASLGRYPLWIADPSSAAGHPRVPHPWKQWTVHQFSWTPLDRDVARFPDLGAFQAALGRSVPRPATSVEDRMFRVLSGANADDGIALPDDVTKIRLGAVGDTTVTIEFHGHPVLPDVKLGWAEGSKEFDRPADSFLVRVYRPATGNPDVPVTLAVS